MKHRTSQGKIALLASRHLKNLIPDGDRDEGVWQVRWGSDVYQIRLKGFYGDGPYCSCPTPESHICVHIWIAVLAAGYAVGELVSRMAFVGEQQTRLNLILFRTLRGLPEEQEERGENARRDEDAPHGGDGEVEPLVYNLTEEEQKVFISCLQDLDRALAQWNNLAPRLTDRNKHAIRNQLWNRFRLLISERDTKRRTRTDAPVPAQTLPRTRTVRRVKKSKRRFNTAVLTSYMLQDSTGAAPETANQTRKSGPSGIEKGDSKSARTIMASARGGILSSLNVGQLKAICKGLGIPNYGKLTKVWCPS